MVLIFFFKDSSDKSDDEEGEVPVRLRRKFVRRKDRTVQTLEDALNSSNFDLIPPPSPERAVK
jgi:hypothetical protein